MTDIAKILRERPVRYASETQDEMQIRRQREREQGADEIEKLRAALEMFACDCEGKAICLGNCMHKNARAALGGKDE